MTIIKYKGKTVIIYTQGLSAPILVGDIIKTPDGKIYKAISRFWDATYTDTLNLIIETELIDG